MGEDLGEVAQSARNWEQLTDGSSEECARVCDQYNLLRKRASVFLWGKEI